MAKYKDDVDFFQGLQNLNHDGLSEFENNSEDKNVATPIKIADLQEYKGHPFKVFDDEGMDELKDSIASQGIINPIIVRPIPEGGFEILVGHRRVHACTLLGMDEIPARIVDLNDDDAALYMVDSNIQRTVILPSEKAFAYKIKLEALKNKDKDITTGKVPDRAAALSEETKDSKKTIYRYIKLTELLPELLDLVDQNKLKATANGYTIACMSKDAQQSILDVYRESAKLPNAKQAVAIKQYADCNEVTKEYIYSILTVNDVKNTSSGSTFSAKIQKFFPEDTTQEKMEELIITLLENWSNV